jgi:HD-GYP domain-containing protein (c-di-GMP phosphodiesterase class II)
MIKKIRVEDLEPGMFIADFNTPWLKHPFFPTRMMVRNARDIERMLRARMIEVHIDTTRGRDSPRAVALDEAYAELQEQMQIEVLRAPTEEEPPRVPFEAELRKARDIYAEAKETVQQQFEDVRRGRRVDGEPAHNTVTDMIASIFRNRDALASLTWIKSFDEYTFLHSLNVTVWTLNLAVNLGILDNELLRLGIGTVLHDLGKVRLPEGLVRKQGPLDDAEVEILKTHAAHGAKLVLEARSMPSDCATVPLSHHERYDGSGYPRQLSGARVGKFGLIASIADVYDAMTSDRSYQKAMSPTQALRKIYGWAGTHFHPLYVRKFIQCLGIYPIGTIVRLDTGEIGVVIRQNRGEPLRPWVRLEGRSLRPPVAVPVDVDLRDLDPDGVKLYARSVEQALDPRTAKVNVRELLWHQTSCPSPTASASTPGTEYV